ncbi:MAG: putative metallopeptidase [Planctomycetota bacterium]|jgi:hypothetical protein
MAKSRAYNMTDDVALLVHLISRRVERLAHIQPGRILHGVSQARNRSKYGIYAQCHGLRFKDGDRFQSSKDGHHWEWPEIRVRGQEMLYYITYFLPRFMDQPPIERLNTLIHELYHISPHFNGDLRRFPGRNEYHGRHFEEVVGQMVEEIRPHFDFERFPFLAFNFDELVEKFGGVVGNRMRRFKPRMVKIEPQRQPAIDTSDKQRKLLFQSPSHNRLR